MTLLHPLGAMLAVGCVALLVSWPLQAALLLLGAKCAGIAGRSYVRCLGVTAIALVAAVPVALVLFRLHWVGSLAAHLTGFMAMAIAGCGLFRTTFGKALLAALIASAIAVGIGLIWAALAGLVMGVLLVLG